MNKKLICHSAFRDTNFGCLHVLNWGEEKNGVIEFETKQGTQRKTKQEIENSCISVLNFEDLDLKGDLYHWYKNHPNQYDKEIKVDYSITTGVEYYGNLWNIGLLINTETEFILIKPIYE